MYTTKNFKTKKQLKEMVDAYLNAAADSRHRYEVRLFAPGIGQPKDNGWETVEGPHFPEPHRWYAQVEVKDGVVVRVK